MVEGSWLPSIQQLIGTHWVHVGVKASYQYTAEAYLASAVSYMDTAATASHLGTNGPEFGISN